MTFAWLLHKSRMTKCYRERHNRLLMASLLLFSPVNSSPSSCALNPLLSTPPSPLRRHFCTAARTRRRFRRRPPVGDGMASPSAAPLPPPLRRKEGVGGGFEGYDDEEAALQPLEPDSAEVETPSSGRMMGGSVGFSWADLTCLLVFDRPPYHDFRFP